MILLLICLGSISLFAQEAEVRGTVTNVEGDTLVGGSVQVVGSVIGAITDINGHYTLEVPPGRIRILASYIGYENYDTTLRISTTEREVELDIVLSESFVDMGEVIVYGRRASGQAQALRIQQSAITQQTVIHSELFNKYPDITLAETVQRMPGVTITRNRGEGELVQVRGLPEQYTAISLNGQRLPAVQPEADRAGSLDIIQSNLVEQVRVVKARSADMDADAIGGTVDFRIRQPEQQFEVLVQGGAGTNFGFDRADDINTGIAQGAVVLNSELSDEQVYGLLAGSFFRHARGNRMQRYDYGENGVTGRSISRVRPIDTDRITNKTGIIGAVELRPSIYNRLRISYNYSAIDEDVYTRETNFGSLGSGFENRITSKWNEERRLNMVALEVENNFNKTQLDYALSFASTSERLIDRQRAYHYLPFGASPDLSEDEYLNLTPFDTKNPATEIPRQSTEQQNLDLEEDIAIGAVNLTRYLNTGRTRFVRVGGRYRIKERNYREFFLRDSFPTAASIPGGSFADLNEEAPLTEDPDLDGGPNYFAGEKIAAAYLMFVNNWNAKVSTSAGLRYEYTNIDYELSGSGGADSLSYNDLFPSLNITYRIRRDRQFRFAYYSAIARVPYSTLVPTSDFEERRQARLDVFSLGNTDVEPTYSNNFDLVFERYGRSDGLISIGVYAKFLDNPTVRTAEYRLVNHQPALGYSLMNTADARLLGVELGFYQNLGFINQGFRFLNLNGNLNFNDYRLADSALEGATLAQAPRRSANLSIVYSNPRQRLNLVIAGNYRSSTLDLLQDGEPIWINAVISLDLAADYELFKDISAYARLNNATDHRSERYIGKPDQDDSLLLSSTNYGVWGVLGLRWRPG
ncbi:TonB-dependent receptor [Neolewinella xylanilytica]|uniref:TonB-dependent receptor n=1 Tax=Neolewinella xylanilytica TaxID=1514080 RepID=A0A2S6IAS0_9BACT|nr:TonB-dependent receptor [Neolewinella xylanilytica]PPK88588.1 TonB-dependent receptor [Neolewinella xylanilytica]